TAYSVSKSTQADDPSPSLIQTDPPTATPPAPPTGALQQVSPVLCERGSAAGLSCVLREGLCSRSLLCSERGALQQGRCSRENCKYLHPPPHLKTQLEINGRNNLIQQKNMAMLAQQMQLANAIMPGTQLQPMGRKAAINI
ncbi:hypothetical protein JZ751_022389, partial [Albula glossodonta]